MVVYLNWEGKKETFKMFKLYKVYFCFVIIFVLQGLIFSFQISPQLKKCSLYASAPIVTH